VGGWIRRESAQGDFAGSGVKKLAVVLITKNQAWNIGRLVESALRGSESVASREILLVDSASTDDTVEFAKRLPIGVIRLSHNQPLTPAAGRYIGYKNTQSEYVLFLDGDMELYPGWVEEALRLLESDRTVGAVTGGVIDVPPESTNRCGVSAPAETSEATEVRNCGGACLYRRAALEDVGTFNPYLYSDEEPELCLRMRYAGHRIMEFHSPMVNHYSEPTNETLSGLVSRRNRKLFVGAGQNIRYFLGTDLLWPYLRERGHAVIPFLALGLGVASFLLSLGTRQWYWFGSWWLLAGVVVLGDAIRKRSVYRMIVSLVKRAFCIEGTMRGLMSRPLAPETYPARSEFIKRLE
jgi:glycosyltransferase involved in cell wall biosynthesis